MGKKCCCLHQTFVACGFLKTILIAEIQDQLLIHAGWGGGVMCASASYSTYKKNSLILDIATGRLKTDIEIVKH
jgi:hypothetical protein